MRIVVALALQIVLGSPHAASAVLIDTGDGTGNVSPPPYNDPGFAWIARRGGLSAVYLGDGAVLTAHHVGPGDVVIEGTSYPWVPGSDYRIPNADGSGSDLLLYAIEPRPSLGSLAIATTPPAYGTLLVIAGNGRNRGDETAWDPNGPYPPGLTGGYQWSSGRSVRWGTNFIEVFPPGRVFNTEAFGSLFEPADSVEEAQAVAGDSGGAAFAWRPGGSFELAGLIIAIVQYADQPSQTTLYGQTTYYADLSAYRDEIEGAIALPEPRGGLGSGAVLLLAMRGRRRRRSAPQPSHQSRLRRRATPWESVPSSPSG